MKVLSLFDGMSGTQLALKKLGIKVDQYFSCEIDKYAIATTQHNFPDTVQLGSVCGVFVDHQGTLCRNDNGHIEFITSAKDIDLIVAGFPCQGFSFAGKQLNFDDPRSALFFEAVRILEAVKPKYFLMENVKMKKECQNRISEILGVQPICIDSALVSAQRRQRLYWTNIPNVTQPEDKGLLLKDVLEKSVDPKYNVGKKLIENYKGGNQLNPDYKSQANTIHNSNGKSETVCAGTHGYANGYIGCIQVGEADLKGHDSVKRIYSPEGKSPCLTTMGDGHREPKVSEDSLTWRKLTPLECERLQTVPDNYTLVPYGKRIMSNTQRYKMLGNGFTVDVIAHILKGMVI